MWADQPPECIAVLAKPDALPDFNDQAAIRRWSQAAEQRFECARLREAGWARIAEVDRQKRQIRRVTFNEGRLAFRIPAVALERLSDGSVWIQISMDTPERTLRTSLPPAAWKTLVGRDVDAKGPQPHQSALGLGCHGWFVTLEGTDGHGGWRQDVSECSNGPDATAFSYGYALAALALDATEQCGAARAKVEAPESPYRSLKEKAVWGLIFCGGRFSPRTIDNP